MIQYYVGFCVYKRVNVCVFNGVRNILTPHSFNYICMTGTSFVYIRSTGVWERERERERGKAKGTEEREREREREREKRRARV